MRPTVFDEEHEALRGEVRRWAEERLAARAADPDAGALDALAAEAGDLGYLGAGQPEASGGSGGDLLAAAVVAEELGRSRAGGAEACLLAQAHAGPTLLAAVGRHDLAGEALGGGRPVALVDGSDRGVLNAGRAAAVLALAPGSVVLASAGWTAAAPAPGRLGWTTADVADLDLRGAVTEELARGERADELVGLQRRRLWLVRAAAAVAGAWATWDDARTYALERHAFGRPVATFQVNRHALAETATRLTAARALVHDLAHAAAAGEDTGPQAAATWSYATRTAADAADAALQLHGGYGYTMEYDVQRAWRDARMRAWDQAGAEPAREQLLAGIGR